MSPLAIEHLSAKEQLPYRQSILFMLEEWGAIWMNKPNRMLQNRTPLNTMVKDGLLAVHVHLDCAFDWRENSS
ncbi:MAG TPA: DUF2384 domain-containing protein [Acidiferrobacteraceae bacterium]|jgi:Antitoxin Xre/MbcA/ParS C-terminal toxin-binding domain|nr:DUF2384 domain-containing protein [Acidiferrobacteraceae bacterium]HEX19984.1 DUF2384 domain-containing protein [Acidiferrobacteraceae bacterium]